MRQTEDKSRTDNTTTNDDYDTLLDHLFSGAFIFGFFWLAYSAIRWLATSILNVTTHLKHNAADPFVALPVGFTVLLIGALFYLLRERSRMTYAALELGSAMGASVEACYRYGTDSSNPAFFFTILGGIYIAVRGFDNLFKAINERRNRFNTQDKN